MPKRTLFLALLCALPLNQPEAASSLLAAQSLALVDGESDSRVILVRRGNRLMGLPTTSVLGTATSSGGKLEIGFVHSGYTAADPDGKQALLTVVLADLPSTLTTADRAQLSANGVEVLDRVKVVVLRTELDVSVRADKAEEARLRQQLGLPKVMSASGNLPLQLRWKEKEGRELYDLLTGPDGLTISTSRDRVEAFLSRGTTGSRLAWTGGPEGLALMLADAGAFVWTSQAGSGPTYPSTESIQSFATSFEDAATCEEDGSCQIDRAQLLGLKWVEQLETQVQLAGRTRSNLAPGSVLIKRPDHVKDLSGEGVGLRALLGRSPVADR